MKASPKGIRTREGFCHPGLARSRGGWPKTYFGPETVLRFG
jgi:hypothetical protein